MKTGFFWLNIKYYVLKDMKLVRLHFFLFNNTNMVEFNPEDKRIYVV